MNGRVPPWGVRRATWLVVFVACTRAPSTLPPDVVPKVVSGRFTVDRTTFAGLDPDQAPALGDCDGDGLLDVVLPLQGRVFRGTTQGFAEVVGALPASTGNGSGATRAAAFIDTDQDGVLDLVHGTQQLLKGRGDCTFASTVDPLFGTSPPLGMACRSGTLGGLVPLDVDGDGLDDLVGRCESPVDPPFVLLLSRGDRTFEIVPVASQASLNPVEVGLPTFNAALDDLDGDGALDGFFLSDRETSWFAWGVPGTVGGFVRDDAITEAIGPTNPMSVAPFDVDRDGRIDWAIATTGCFVTVLEADGGRALTTRVVSGDLQPASCFAWSTYAGDFDFDGWPDLLTLRSEATADDPVLGRARAPFLWMNDGTGLVVERSAVVSMPEVDGVAGACGDLKGNGQVGCVVAGRSGLSVLQGRVAPVGSMAGVRLVGTVSSLNASGARVEVRGEGASALQVWGHGAGTETAHVPWGPYARPTTGPVELEIRWPSGLVQRVPDEGPGKYVTVAEPRVVELSARVALPDGTTRVDVRVRPALAGATVATIEREGDGRWVGEATLDEDGVLHRTLEAPLVEGEARIVVGLDGVALKVRPKVRFRSTARR